MKNVEQKVELREPGCRSSQAKKLTHQLNHKKKLMEAGRGGGSERRRGGGGCGKGMERDIQLFPKPPLPPSIFSTMSATFSTTSTTIPKTFPKSTDQLLCRV